MNPLLVAGAVSLGKTLVDRVFGPEQSPPSAQAPGRFTPSEFETALQDALASGDRLDVAQLRGHARELEQALVSHPDVQSWLGQQQGDRIELLAEGPHAPALRTSHGALLPLKDHPELNLLGRQYAATRERLGDLEGYVPFRDAQGFAVYRFSLPR